MITLYGFGPALNVTEPSPFVLKVLLILKVAGVDFTLKNGTQFLRTAPKGKLPYLEHNGDVIADSFFIEKYLKKELDVDLDKHLTRNEKAISEVLRTTLEERVYWCIVYFRWQYAGNWPTIKQTFFGQMPFLANVIVPKIARRNVLRQIQAQGLGRHSESEIVTIADTVLSSCSDLLGETPYIFGDKVSRVDICMYAHLVQILRPDNLPSPLLETTHKYQNLVDFCDRFSEIYDV